jgi:hypothetical protein
LFLAELEGALKFINNMKTAICTLKSTSPYSQGRYHETPKKDKELHADYEERTWRDKLHTLPETGQVFIPPMSFAVSIKEAAKYLNIQIPGKGKSTFTKNFDAGIMVTEPLLIDAYKDSVLCEKVFVPADGRRGGRVRHRPRGPQQPTPAVLVDQDAPGLAAASRT